MRETFDALFIAPFATHHWESRRARSHWCDLGLWQDTMAGPLSAIVESGGCEYVYQRMDWGFSSVNDPADLKTYLMECYAGLASGVEEFRPTTPEEANDLLFMRSIVARIAELIAQAYAVEERRWRAARGA